jgi:lipid-A-disaccharide synthase
MPNIMAGKSICPELVAGAATPKAIAQAAVEILKDEQRMRHMREELLGIKSMLGEPGSVSRAASLVLDTIG